MLKKKCDKYSFRLHYKWPWLITGRVGRPSITFVANVNELNYPWNLIWPRVQFLYRPLVNKSENWSLRKSGKVSVRFFSFYQFTSFRLRKMEVSTVSQAHIKKFVIGSKWCLKSIALDHLISSHRHHDLRVFQFIISLWRWLISIRNMQFKICNKFLDIDVTIIPSTKFQMNSVTD